jgi:hypothetical protein
VKALKHNLSADSEFVGGFCPVFQPELSYMTHVDCVSSVKYFTLYSLNFEVIRAVQQNALILFILFFRNSTHVRQNTYLEFVCII